MRSSKEAMLNRTVALADRRWESIDAVARRADVPPQLWRRFGIAKTVR